MGSKCWGVMVRIDSKAKIPNFLWAVLCALVLLKVEPICARSVFIIGTEEKPWPTNGVTPGGVIDFVEDLDQVQTLSGLPVFEESQNVRTDWIMPLRLDPDLNISRGIMERGGDIDVPILARSELDRDELLGMINGDHAVAYDRKFVTGRIVRNNGITIRIDLGARFGVNRIVFYPRMTEQFPFANDYLRGYEIFLNDGLSKNLFASGQPIFTSPVLREPDNRSARADVEIDPQFVRYLELKSISPLGFEIDEIELYGSGFVPTARYVSNVIDLGGDAVWGQINWIEALTGNESDSKLEVRVRAGRDLTPDRYFRNVSVDGVNQQIELDASGDTLTLETFERLKENERGPIRADTESWSSWQLARNGGDLNLPAPRRYFQFSIDFANADLSASRAMAELAFSYERPPVDLVIAEIEPPETEVGEETQFTYFARIENGSDRSGFTRFAVETPARVTSIESVEIFDVDESVIAAADFSQVDLSKLPYHSANLSIEAVEDTQFLLGLPLVNTTGTLIKTVFRGEVFRYGTRFRGAVYADETTIIPLYTEGGDATAKVATNDLLVRVLVGSNVAGPIEVWPKTFTPNGDGINDRVRVSCTVLHLLDPTPTIVSVYDVMGRKVRQLSKSLMQNGRIELYWDGRDDEGKLLSPGNYIVQSEIHSDRGVDRQTSNLIIAY